jgi:hypothetical protein
MQKKFIMMMTEGYEGSLDLNEVAAYHEVIPEDPRTAPAESESTTVLLKSGAHFNIRGNVRAFRQDMEKFLKDTSMRRKR